MNKLKLMILSIVLLASQLNGLMIKFVGEERAIEVNVEGCEELLRNLPTHSLSNPSDTYVELNIRHEEFDSISGFLIHLNRVNNDFMGHRIPEQEAKNRILHELDELGPRNEIIRRISPSLNCHLLDSILLSVQGMGISHVNPLPVSSSLQALPESVSIKISADVVREEDGVFTITKGMCDLSKTLKTILEVSETQDTINVPNVNIVTMRLLIPLWKSAADLSLAEMTDSQRKAQLEKIIKDSNFTLEQLDILLEAVNFLDIKVLFGVLTTEIERRLLTSEATNLFRLHPERFNVSNLIHFNFSLPDLSHEIIRNMPQGSLLDGLWRIQNILQDHLAGIICIAVMPDGRIVAGSGNGTVKIWTINADGKTSFIEFIDHNKAYNRSIISIAVMSDGRIVTLGEDGEVRVWTINAGGTTSFVEFRMDTDLITSIAVMPDGRIVTLGGEYGEVRVWTINADGTTSFIGLRGHTDLITYISVMPDGRIVTSARDGKVRVWMINAGGTTSFVEFEIDVDLITCISVMPDGRIVTGTRDGKVRVWTINADGTTSFVEFGTNIDFITCISVMPDGRIVAGGRGGEVRVCTINADGIISFVNLRAYISKIICIAVMPDGRIFTVAQGGRVKIWTINADDTSSFVDFRWDVRWITSIVVMPDGRIITIMGAPYSTMRLYNNISITSQLTLEQILFINAFKQKPLDCSNPEFRRIFASLDPRIQSELKKLVVERIKTKLMKK